MANSRTKWKKINFRWVQKDKMSVNTNLICRPYITLRNGKILWAWQKGLKAFCFPASLDYIPKKKTKTSEGESEVK